MFEKKLSVDDLLNEKNQAASLTYLREVLKIEDIKNQLLVKKRMADKEIERLTIELADLEKKYLLETDQAKIKELAGKKKEIRSEIEEYDSIKSMKYNPIIKDMLKDIDHYREEAQKEKSKFESTLLAEINQHKEELAAFTKEMKAKIESLEKLKHKHTFNHATTKDTNMRMDKGEW